MDTHTRCNLQQVQSHCRSRILPGILYIPTVLLHPTNHQLITENEFAYVNISNFIECDARTLEFLFTWYVPEGQRDGDGDPVVQK